MSEISSKQQAILRFIRRQVQTQGRPPTYEEIRRACKLSTKSLVAYHLRALEAAGLIKRTRDVSRGIRVTAPLARTFTLSIYGTIQAGGPVESDRVEEAIELTRDIVPESDGLYGLRVRGDSMRDALVNEGDIVVLKHQREARNGEMVAVRLKDRDESTLKRFFLENGRVRLQPANPAYKDIIVHPSKVEIQGRVVAVIRRLSVN
jgi:repressor LexA